jgi:hypothetical protein
MPQLNPSPTGPPSIESVSDDGEVEVTLADGRRRVIHVPIEHVAQLRRVAFLDERRRVPIAQFAFEG